MNDRSTNEPRGIESDRPFDDRRRSLTKALGAGLIAAPFLSLTSKTASAAEPLVLVSWGGVYQDAFNRTIVQPFVAETGIPMKIVSGPDLAKAKAQVRTGNIEWDIFDGTGPHITGGETEDLWEPIDTQIVDLKDMSVPARKSSIPIIITSGSVAYAPSQFQGKRPPETFADMWDVKNFPGRRGLRNRISETLEIALLADGVAPSKMYPLDVERGFRSLAKIKPNVTKWLEQTLQAITLLTAKEIDYSYAYGSRVIAARKTGADIDLATRQSIILNEYFAVLKGTKKRDNAMKFLNFSLQPKNQAALASALTYLPVKRAAMALMDKTIAGNLPDLANPNNVLIDDTWWAPNYAELDRRFKEWLLTS